jgi:uncharacterized protein
MSITTHQFTYTGADDRLSTADLTYNTENTSGSTVLLLHGFKSFKDWGCWPWFAEQLASKGHIVLKLNFSHNGTTPTQLQDFADLHAFGENNFMKQVADVACFLAQYQQHLPSALKEKASNSICCIGHSLGGGIAILAAARHNQIDKLITLNSVNDFGKMIKRHDAQKWQSEGVVYEHNARTKQDMPLHYQLYENYIANEQALDIQSAAASITCPWLWIYATHDETVSPQSVERLKAVNSTLQSLAITNTGHTFGAAHPFVIVDEKLVEMCDAVLGFVEG